MDNLIHGLTIALQAQNLFYCFIGCLAGTLVGVLPGIGPTGAVALLLPVDLSSQPDLRDHHDVRDRLRRDVRGVDHLDPRQCPRRGLLGGHLPRRLRRWPRRAGRDPPWGSPPWGPSSRAPVGVVGLMFLAPTLSRWALVFDSPDYFALMMMSLVVVTYLVRGSMLKALIMVAWGWFSGPSAWTP